MGHLQRNHCLGTAIAAIAAVLTLAFQMYQTRSDKVQDDAKTIRTKIESNMLENTHIIGEMDSGDVFVQAADKVADQLFSRIPEDANFERTLAELNDDQNEVAASVEGYADSNLAQSFEQSKRDLADNAKFFQGGLSILSFTSVLSNAIADRNLSSSALLRVIGGRHGPFFNLLQNERSLDQNSRTALRTATARLIYGFSIALFSVALDPIIDDLYEFDQKLHGRFYNLPDAALVRLQSSGAGAYLDLPKDSLARQKFIADKILSELVRINNTGIVDVSDLIPLFDRIRRHITSPPEKTDIEHFLSNIEK